MTLHLKAAEGDALRIAELLVGHGRSGPLPPVIDVSAPSDALVEAVARTVAAGCLQFLLYSGGAKERAVLRDARRKSGRLWSPELNEHFDMQFTRATRAFWLNVTKELVPLVHKKRADGDLTREDRKVVRAVVPESYDGVGDLVFFALAHENASSLHLPKALEEGLQHELRKTSPLALLFGINDATIDADDVRASLAQLLAPGPLRVVECIDNALVEAWLLRFRTVLLHSPERQVFLAQMRAMGRNLGIWVALLDEAGRMDLARSVVRFLALWPRRAFPTGIDLRNHALRLPGTSSMAERDEALRAMLSVADVRLALDDARTRLGQQRYGDDRYGEAQVFVRLVEDDLVPHRDAVDALARTLSGAVG